MVAAGCRVPLNKPRAGTPLSPDRLWRTALGRSLREEHDYEAHVEGRLPAGLQGQLYRNGPGLFDRGGYRKQHLLDGDGMLQCFDFSNGRVGYRNRFVRTEKFITEEAADAFIHPTWTTLAPGGLFANLGGRIKSQAGVTTLVRDGRLLALDEVIPLYVLDPGTLETIGRFNFPEGVEMSGCKAHTKSDPVSGDWILAATGYGRSMTLRWLVLGKDGKVKAQGAVKSPRMTYLHDFMVTERHIVFILHPVEFSPFGLLLGLRSFTDSLTWMPEQGNLVMVLDRSGGQPVFVEAPAAFMWHALNAYEQNGSIVADFVGYDNPDHFIGRAPAFAAVMRGEDGDAEFPGAIRRYIINLETKTLRQEIVDSGSHDFPMVDPRSGLRKHRYGYFACGHPGDWILDGVARVDMEGGTREEFRFGPRHFVGEPIFAPRGSGADHGWILAQVHSDEAERNFLAVFDADNLAAGPVAQVRLRHHVPLSFHGFWHADA
jgi:all-trans-8'-apo-beta-carotenal 15,15'-oxygenase